MAMSTAGLKWEVSEDNGNLWTDLGCIRSYTWTNPERAEIDTTCLASTSKEFMFGFPDSGTVSFTGFYDVGSEQAKIIEDGYKSSQTLMWRLTYTDTPDGGGTPTTKTFEAFVTTLEESAAVDGVIEFSFDIKITGDVQEVPAQPTP